MNFKKILLGVAIITLYSINPVDAQTSKEKTATEVVQTMLGAFGKGDMEGLKATLSDKTVWNYQGTKEIPYAGVYEGKDGVMKFIGNIMANVDIMEFNVTSFVAEGNVVVVLGNETQKIKSNGEIIKQDWVQIYTVENELIIKMSEFANTSNSAKLFSK